MHQNDGWCWDFVEDSDVLGRPLRFLTLVDEYTRDGLLLEAERSMTGERIRDLIAEVFTERGAPRQNGYGKSFNGRHRDELLNPRIVRDLRRPPRGEGAPRRGGKRRNCAYDGTTPTLMVLDQRSRAGQPGGGRCGIGARAGTCFVDYSLDKGRR
jgi:hypothetical protein